MTDEQQINDTTYAELDGNNNLIIKNIDEAGIAKLASELDANNQDISNVGSFDANSVSTGAINNNADIVNQTQPLLDAVNALKSQQIIGQDTESVSTTTKDILRYDRRSALVFVGGFSSSDGATFCDLLFVFRQNENAVVLNSQSEGTAASRSYTVNGDTLQLSMGSSTYDVSAIGFKLDQP